MFNIEADPDNFREIQRHTAPWVERGVTQNLSGSFRQWVSEVLRQAGGSPLFAFLDPFRPADLLFEDFTPVLVRAPVTELCLVSHSPAIHREICAVRAEARTPEPIKLKTRATLSNVLGGNRWERLLEGPAPTTDAVVQCFVDEMQARVPAATYAVWHAIRALYGVGLKYHIIFLTRNKDGVRLMNDAFCKETQTAYATGHPNQQMKLALESTPPVELSPADQIRDLIDTLLEIATAWPSRRWRRADLRFEAMRRRFGEFSQTQHNRAIKQLATASSPPRLPVVGQAGESKVLMNDETLVQFELQSQS